MPFWLILLAILGATVAFNALMARRLKQERQKPASLGDFNFPTSTERRGIPVIVGTGLQKGPNCTWNGDLQSIPVTKKVPNPATFGITKKTVETGQYRYFVGMMLALGQGEESNPIHLREIWVDEKVVWSGNITSGTITVDKQDLFGGEEKEGGVAGTFDFYGGTWTQPYNAYLQSQFPSRNIQKFRGVSYLMQRGPSSGKIAPKCPNGYVGIGSNLKPYAFVLQRFPNHLGQPEYTVINGDDANPVEFLYEILTNYDWGRNFDPSIIKLSKFQAAAQRVHTDGLGMSLIWDQDRDLDAVVNDILELIDGACFIDPNTGMWDIELARDDSYDVDDLMIFDENNIDEYVEFGVNTIENAPSQVIVSYVDKSQKFKDREADYKDTANAANQGYVISHKVEFWGCANPDQAAQLAFRESRVFASNLRKATFKANRDASKLKPMMPFIYRQPNVGRPGYTEVIMRCGKIDFGSTEDESITVECLEDVFGLGEIRYEPPPVTNHVAISGDAVATSNAYLSEQPYLISGKNQRLWAMSRKPNGTQVNYDLYMKKSGDSDYSLAVAANDFAPTGTINSTYGRTGALDSSNSLVITMNEGIARLDDTTETAIRETMDNCFLFADTGEICAYRDATDNGDGTVTLNNVYRGLLDTAIESHASGTRVWFFPLGQALPENAITQGTTYNTKFVTKSLRESLPLGSAQQLNHTGFARSSRPILPANVRINGTLNATSIPAAGNDITIAWNTRNRLSQNTVLFQNDASVNPETGQTVTIKIYKSGGSLLKEYSGLTGTSFTWTSAMQTTDLGDVENALVFVIYSKRGDIDSLQAVVLNTTRPGGTPTSSPAYSSTGTYTAPPEDTATSINGIPVVGTPTTPGQTPTYNADGELEWTNASGLTEEQVEDIVADLVEPGTGIDVEYNDSLNKLIIRNTIEVPDIIVEDCEFVCGEDGDYLTE